MKVNDAPNLSIRETPGEAAGECVRCILASLAETLNMQSKATVAISGGSTPKLLFAELAKAEIDWSKVHFFWVDERCVPPADKGSNYKLAKETLLAPAHIREGNVHRIYGELPPEQAAKRYAQEITNFFNLQGGQLPVFDILHRGMGPDAHTASLFPGEPLIHNRTDIAANVWVEKFKMHRVTLLPGVLLAAKRTVLQVSGSEKADAVKNVLTGPEDLLNYPCQIASRDSRANWFLDQAAAAKL